MYSVHDGSVSGFPPVEWVSKGTLPKVPLDLNMVLPGGEGLKRNIPEVSPGGAQVVEAALGEDRTRSGGSTGTTPNWSQFGFDMLSQGIKDTTSIIAAAIGGAGRQSVQQGYDKSFEQQLAQQQLQMQAQAQQQQLQMQAAAMQQQMALEQQRLQMEMAQAQKVAPPAQSQMMYPMTGQYPAEQPKVKKKLPTWAWVLIGLGGAGAIGGGLYWFLGRDKGE